MRNFYLMIVFIGSSTLLWAQEKKITGTVTDDNGESLPGVSVIIKGTAIGTITDVNGKFTLDISVDANQVLVFSYVGMTPEEVKIGSQTFFEISMIPDIQSLSEIVVIGYGSVKKSDLTGSVASVSAKELTQTPISSLDQGLQGRAPGVQITQNSGAPGGAASVVIRGGSSLSTSNQPLYVIDGVPIAAGGSAPGGSLLDTPGGQLNPLATINPSDIQSIEILKDASSTSIYGARGANGVVLITTKKGSEGTTRINYSGYVGLQEITRTLDVLEKDDALDLLFELDPNIILDFEPVETDWQDEIFRTAPIQNHQLSFSGGGPKAVYNFSLNRFDQDGIVRNSDFARTSARLNLESKLSNFLTVGTNLNYSYSVNNGALSSTTGEGLRGVVSQALGTPSYFPAYDEQGKPLFFGDVIADSDLIPNPIAVSEILNRNTSTRLLGNAYFNIQIAEGFTYRASFGTDIFHDLRDTFIGNNVPQGRNVSGIAGKGNVNQKSIIHESVLNYVKDFGEDHSISLSGVFSTQKFDGENSLASGTDLPTDLLDNNNLELAATRDISSNKESWRLDSYTGRINYTLMNKYLFTLTARADGSTRFGKNNKWGFFPSAAFAWKINEEKFLAENDVISELKFRVSHGVTGNANVPLYRSLSRLSSGINYNFSNSLNIGISPDGIPNPDIKWERTAQTDIGIDLGLFYNRIELTADYYHKKTTDVLLSKVIPASSGFSTVFGNFGSLENSGFELGLSAIVLNKGLNWEINGNISFNKNEVTGLDGNSDRIIPTGSGGVGAFATASILQIGRPVGSFFGYISEGVWKSTDDVAGSHMPTAVPGDPRYADFNGDGSFTEDDRTIIGDPNPDYFFGINNTLSYKGIDLTFFLQGVQGNDVFFQRRMVLESVGGTAQLATVLNRWRPGAEDTDIPRALGGGRRLLQSSNFIEDGSFVRLKNVTLGYTFKAEKIASWISNLRVYISGNNLWTITDYTGYDPELNTTGVNNVTNFGIDRDPFPRAKSYLFGIEASF